MSTSVSQARQSWTHPEAEEDQPTLICLTPEALLTAVIAREDLDQTIDILNKGGSIAGQTIPLSAISRLEGEAEENTLEVTFYQGESKIQTTTVTLADAGQRDEFLAALTAALGPGWAEERRQKNRFLAALWPVGVLVVVCLVGWLLYFDAQQIAAGGQPLAAKGPRKVKGGILALNWLAGLLGPTGVVVVVGILVVPCLIWLSWTLARPPIRILVQPKADQAGDGNPSAET